MWTDVIDTSVCVAELIVPEFSLMLDSTSYFLRAARKQPKGTHHASPP